MAEDSIASASAEDVIRLLDLSPHPEGGFYRETFRDPATNEAGRAASTAIYFLLAAGQISHWHRVDAAESWHFYAGAPLAISVSQTGEDLSRHLLGPDLFKGESPQFIVPAHWWQSATSLGAWTLVGCGVAPGFEFAHFEIAPPGWGPRSAAR
ncbi:cupin domain-containing protein [Methylocella tundrae]|uniref:Cupin n=1 Tax=Methylocella tundrae TaxID=227605 RepID=A0A4U8Z573_METTU|nr:cupin domain-containing protein [Methylocella tundrae]WPP04358.1 cupin domain-containing protein [Methylocella tundrae]VFU10703.1 Cupin [Methylocella tundrae]